MVTHDTPQSTATHTPSAGLRQRTDAKLRARAAVDDSDGRLSGQSARTGLRDRGQSTTHSTLFGRSGPTELAELRVEDRSAFVFSTEGVEKRGRRAERDSQDPGPVLGDDDFGLSRTSPAVRDAMQTSSQDSISCCVLEHCRLATRQTQSGQLKTALPLLVRKDAPRMRWESPRFDMVSGLWDRRGCSPTSANDLIAASSRDWATARRHGVRRSSESAGRNGSGSVALSDERVRTDIRSARRCALRSSHRRQEDTAAVGDGFGAADKFYAQDRRRTEVRGARKRTDSLHNQPLRTSFRGTALPDM